MLLALIENVYSSNTHEEKSYKSFEKEVYKLHFFKLLVFE